MGTNCWGQSGMQPEMSEVAGSVPASQRMVASRHRPIGAPPARVIGAVRGHWRWYMVSAGPPCPHRSGGFAERGRGVGSRLHSLYWPIVDRNLMSDSGQDAARHRKDSGTPGRASTRHVFESWVMMRYVRDGNQMGGPVRRVATGWARRCCAAPITGHAARRRDLDQRPRQISGLSALRPTSSAPSTQRRSAARPPQPTRPDTGRQRPTRNTAARAAAGGATR